MQQISTLDLVLRSSGGALLVPLKKAASILGLDASKMGGLPIHRPWLSLTCPSEKDGEECARSKDSERRAKEKGHRC